MWSPAQMIERTSRWISSSGALCHTTVASPVLTSPTQIEKSYPPAKRADVIPSGHASPRASPRSARAPKGSPGLRMKATRVPSGEQVGLTSRSTAGMEFAAVARPELTQDLGVAIIQRVQAHSIPFHNCSGGTPHARTA